MEPSRRRVAIVAIAATTVAAPAMSDFIEVIDDDASDLIITPMSSPMLVTEATANTGPLGDLPYEVTYQVRLAHKPTGDVSIVVTGDSQTLIVHASLPSRASSGLGPPPSSAGTAATAAAAAMTSDQQSVAYFLVGSSSRLAQQLSQNLASSGAVPYGQKGTGLARLQGDRMAMEAADESGDYSVLSARVQLVAPEVASDVAGTHAALVVALHKLKVDIGDGALILGLPPPQVVGLPQIAFEPGDPRGGIGQAGGAAL